MLVAAAGALLLIYQWRWGRMLWLDEEMIAINLRDRTITQLAGRLSLGQAAPFGWLAIERAVFVVFGPAERALRALPLLFGIGLLATSVWVGCRWMARAGAITLAFLCATGQWISFHALELKHYSADACFGLLLPALAVWAIEQDRLLTWWIAAAVAQWFSNGALFVAPVCAVIVVLASANRLRAALPGTIWLVSFIANYVINLGPARSSEFLQHFWASAFPPAGAGALATLAWAVSQISPLALKPVGSGLGIWFWVAAGSGFVFARASLPLRSVFALVPLSGIAWAAVRLVPMFERLSLWIVPSLFVGVALAADAATTLVVQSMKSRRWPAALAGAMASCALVGLLVDVATRGTTYVAVDEPIANHDVDDRGAVRWLGRQRQAGDVWVTTHNALPAIWWYANDDAPAFEVALDSDPGGCGALELGETLRRAGAARALVYLGFGHHIPPEFDDVLVSRLGSLGRVAGYNRFGQNSHSLVVDLRDAPTGPITLGELGSPGLAPPRAAQGCITVSPASRW